MSTFVAIVRHQAFLRFDCDLIFAFRLQLEFSESFVVLFVFCRLLRVFRNVANVLRRNRQSSTLLFCGFHFAFGVLRSSALRFGRIVVLLASAESMALLRKRRPTLTFALETQPISDFDGPQSREASNDEFTRSCWKARQRRN